ncbi:MAG TPA: hypothetical protein P5572_02475 [Phycisphaerae bacterium]|nr:hypothetical protein [Phycisphaerales bacterium]HRX83867.1 hypothetical protein [Phycisphaerae bacterium]
MPTVVYKAHSRLDLRDARTALTRAGIAAQTIGDPDMHCAPGTKVSYFVELAVDDADVERARAVLAARDRAGEDRIRPLTEAVHRGVLKTAVAAALLIALGFVVFRGGFFDAVPYLFVGAFVCLMMAPWLKQALQRRRQARVDAGLCGNCNYNLRGNRSGRCPECGAAVPPPSRNIRRRRRRRW